MAMPMPAEHDQADCDNAFIQISGSNNRSKSTENMNVAPSRLPSSKSIHSDKKRDMNSRTKREIISTTLTFSIALAPFQIAARVSKITKNWKKITCPGDCKNEFQTSVVSTPSPVKPPVIPS